MRTTDEFTQSYIQAALWSSTDNEGDPLDEDYNANNLSEELHAQMVADCKSFQQFSGLWENATEPNGTWTVEEQAGHDFWLTRNGHGAGFWDRPEIYGKVNADKLTEICKLVGECPIYVGDDGMIYGN